MRLLIIAAAVMLAPAPLSAAPISNPLAVRSLPVAAQECRDARLHFAGKAGKAKASRLGELPPGNLELGVVREVGGCRTPVIVRYGIGR